VVDTFVVTVEGTGDAGLDEVGRVLVSGAEDAIFVARSVETS
jgi:hypothetical protein